MPFRDRPPTQPPPAGWPIDPSLLVTGPNVPGFHVARALGLVGGACLVTPASVNSLLTSEVLGFEQQMIAARTEACHRMANEAGARAGNAVVEVRIQYGPMLPRGQFEVLAYGTAVWVEPNL